MRSKKLLAILPAWALVATLVVMGSGSTYWGPHYGCGNPCGYKVTIDIDQENYGNGYNRTNFADADIDFGGQRWYQSGGKIDIDQENVGYGSTRDNVAYADIENGGGYGGWFWGGYGGYAKGKIDIDQENYGNGNNRDNAAFASWTW